MPYIRIIHYDSAPLHGVEKAAVGVIIGVGQRVGRRQDGGKAFTSACPLSLMPPH
jgi:hypothetical protein